MIKKKVALVLAGGGSLGSYQVGALEALQELGYKFDIVTGTSIGALNGAFVCNGQTDKLRKLWEDITPEQVMKNGINLSIRELGASPKTTFAVNFGKWGFKYLTGGKMGADISPFKEYCKNALDVDACLASEVKFGIVTTVFPSMSGVDIDMNRASKEQYLPFLHASSACFPIFPIEKIGKKRFVDGFYSDNLPIRLAFTMGADEIIAIDMKLFSLEPQNVFYLTLPNVQYIAPYIKMGSLMDFSQTVIRNNMKLGYNDVMKHFGKYRGYSFTFSEVPEVHNYLSYVLRQYGTDSKYFIDKITEEIRSPMTETDFFLRTLELIAIRIGIEDYYDVFTFDEFKQRIIDKINEIADKTANREVKLNTIIDYIMKTGSFTKSQKVFNEYLVKFAFEYLNVDLKSVYIKEKKKEPVVTEEATEVKEIEQ